MKILPEILKKEGINSLEDFNQFLSENKSITTLKLTKTVETHEDNIVIENQIIEVEELCFLNFLSLSFKNCIFMGKVNLYQNIIKEYKSIKIEIENCIFLKEFLLSNNKNLYNIEIYNSNFAYLSFHSLKARELIIHHSRVFMLNMSNINIQNFEAENNKIEYMEIGNYQIENINFDFHQLNKNFIKNRLNKKFFSFNISSYSHLKFDINLFDFIKFYGNKELKEKVHYDSLNNLLNFVKNNTNLNNDKKNLNDILFWESFLSQKTTTGKLFIWITRAFFYPERFLIFGAITFFIFSFIYIIPFSKFLIEGSLRTLNLKEALYFSGVTFTTLGYGDILPIGISRFFAVSEAVLGILIMNIYMVSLLKKYID